MFGFSVVVRNYGSLKLRGYDARVGFSTFTTVFALDVVTKEIIIAVGSALSEFRKIAEPSTELLRVAELTQKRHPLESLWWTAESVWEVPCLFIRRKE